MVKEDFQFRKMVDAVDWTNIEDGIRSSIIQFLKDFPPNWKYMVNLHKSSEDSVMLEYEKPLANGEPAYFEMEMKSNCVVVLIDTPSESKTIVYPYDDIEIETLDKE